eukprot:g18022.t1
MASSGVNFPQDAEGGKRATTQLNQGAFAKSVEAADPALAAEVRQVKNWRFGYASHVCKQTELACTSEATALQIAQDGLDYLHTKMVFERDGKELSVRDAMKKFQPGAGLLGGSTASPGALHTATVKGSGATGRVAKKLEVPYGDKILSGPELVQQIDSWVRKGVIELSAGQALMNVVENEQWTDLSDQTIVLCGAGSAMGPYPLLMQMGCNVVALDLPRSPIWERLIALAKESPGTLIFPVSRAVSAKESLSTAEYAAIAGCDLLAQTPEVRNWLLTVSPNERLVIGAYAYLDGPLFVRVSVAMDAVIESLMELRKKKIALAYLCTPTDAHLCGSGATAQAAAEFRRAPLWMKLYNAVATAFCPRRRLVKNARKPVRSSYLADGKTETETTEFFVCDATVPDQGPNYILAKRLQHWRAIVARSKEHLVSTNIAPSTATVSVTSNKLFALGTRLFGDIDCGGLSGFTSFWDMLWTETSFRCIMHHFKPMEIFQGATSNSVMAALLINDLRNPLSVANPARKLKNPMQLFTENAAHGGAWRCGWKFGSLGGATVLAAVLVEYLVRWYLLLYNVVQCAGWSVILAKCVEAAATGGASGMSSIWVSAGWWVTVVQFLSLLEIVHGAMGMVKASPGITALQVFSRINLVVVANLASLQSPFIFAMVFAWSLTEAVRYSFFATNLLKLPNCYPLKWCRYTLFIVLYPMGVTGELGTMFAYWSTILGETGTAAAVSAASSATSASSAGAAFAHSSAVYAAIQPAVLALLRTLSKGDGWLVGFGVPVVPMLFVYALYAPGLPFLYLHLLAQRKKALSCPVPAVGGKGKQSRVTGSVKAKTA